MTEHHHHEDHHGHDHGADCTCGCHDHEHHHEDGHHHHGPERVSIMRHEGALIGSMKGNLICTDWNQGQELLTEQMRSLGTQVNEAGGIIGHIKFVLSAPGPCCQISLTDTEETRRYFDGEGCQVEGVAIVFCVEEKALEAMMLETLGTILE